MSSSSSNHMEEDAWLMKIKLKREDPVGAAKEDKSKEATRDQVLIIKQALPADEEEEDILKPYYAYLTPTEIEAFRIIEIIRIQNKHSGKYSASRAYHPPPERHLSIGESLNP